jgi:succinate dehydrogenase/fumarate reductase flavoprotein subunit
LSRQLWESAEDDEAAPVGSGSVEDLDADVVVAGGGVGGLMAAYRAQQVGARVVILGGSGGASNRISSMNTALGYSEQDTPARLFDDMFRAGGYVNEPAVVAAFSRRIGAETRALVELGVPLHRDGARLARRQAAGSTWTRAVYSIGMLGVDIARALTAALDGAEPSVVRIKGGLLVELLRDEGRITGALGYSPRDGRWVRVTAPAVVLATGGGGQLFGRTTNPRGSKGTGYALALEAGAELTGMEFVSFEPFVTSAPEGATGHDLPTTVLREGARLRNGRGEEFLDTASAPTKDIICRSMVREVSEGRGTPSGSVFYDIREMDPAVVDRYIQIKEALRARRITSREGLLEVMPAQHFLMGGVRIDGSGASTVPGLFAVGEAAGGAHGAHRLAAGGGMEVVVGGAITGESAARYAADRGPLPAPSALAAPRPDLLSAQLSPENRDRLGRVQAALDSGCGILREEGALTASVATVELVVEEVADRPGETFMWRSSVVALAIARSALSRTESRGDHFRTDHPDRDDSRWLGSITTTLDRSGRLVMRYRSAALVPQAPGKEATVASPSCPVHS